MITISVSTADYGNRRIKLGKQGEHEVRQIAFDLTFMIERYGDGLATLVFQRNGDPAPYTITATRSENLLTWTVNETDTAVAGPGKAEIRWYVSGALAKTVIFTTETIESIVSETEVPDRLQTWYDQLIDYVDAQPQLIIDDVQGLIDGKADASTVANTYAKKTDVPNKTSQLTNDSGFLTELPSGYVTEQDLASKGFLTEDDISGKADQEDLDVLSSRFDSAVSAVSTDTELTDIRVTVDGTTETTAGTAVRKQVQDLKDDISSLNEDITNLRLDIIDGYVATEPQIESFSPAASNYTAQGIKPSDGTYYSSGKAVFNINNTATTYYMLVSNDFIPDDIKKIESKYDSVYFALIVYSKVDSSYLGVIYREYSYRSAAELASDYNRIYPYQEVDMDELRSLFPDYYFRVEITDTAVNGETACVPADITSWCSYYRITAASQRRLVKTVNGASPDSNGNVTVPVDTTLSVASAAADAKTVGDEIGVLKNAKVYPLLDFGHLGYYIKTDGTIKAAATWGYTDSYYPVNSSTTYYVKCENGTFVAEYDTNYSFVKCYSVSVDQGKFKTSATTSYVRFSAKEPDWLSFCFSTANFFGNYSVDLIDSAIKRSKEIASGKKIVCFGDSITGNYLSPYDYPSRIASLTGATAVNVGFGGTCMSDEDSSGSDKRGLFSFCRLVDAIVDDDFSGQEASGFERNCIDSDVNYVPERLGVLKNMDWGSVDAITVFYGTNDWGRGHNIDDMEDPYNTYTYLGAFRYAFEKFQTAYPGIMIIPICPLFRLSYVDGAWYDSNEYDRGYGIYLYELANKLVEISKTEYQTDAIDMYHKCMITKRNHTRYLRDGLHPTTTDGQILVSKLILSSLNFYI